MTEQIIEFNLEDAFGELEQAAKQSNLLKMFKAGESAIMAMLPPLEYKGKKTLFLQVASSFADRKTGKQTTSDQFLIRFMIFTFENGKVDYSKTQYVAVPLAKTFAEQLAKAFKSEYQLAQQECHLIELNKAEKMVLTFKPKLIKIADEAWQKGLNTPTWEEIVEAHQKMEDAKANKGKDVKKPDVVKDESTPWDN